MKNSASNQELKKLVGIEAAKLVEDGMLLGIGTGSTVVFFIEELGRRVQTENLHVTGVPTSFQSKLLCQHLNIKTVDPQDCSYLDLAVDGADEVDPELNAIKGGGGAHTREKIIAAMAQQFLIIIDESKQVTKLGSTFPVPIEIIPTALKYVSDTIIRLGGEPQLRMGIRKDGPVITDNGQFILDARFNPQQVDLRDVDQKLHQTPGVVETGLFYDLAKQVLVGAAAEMTVKTLVRK
ncbi:MAG: ribose-5-phosphate isomerase RpiA [Firmicutes bacterium]|nr:ribose-5-phosphate isomerase RpiA [Bacillota bacterium]